MDTASQLSSPTGVRNEVFYTHTLRLVMLRPLFLVLLLFCALPAFSQAPPEVIAIEHVTVVPMDAERHLADHTVVVRDGVITAVGPSAETPVPEGARRIDGRGRFVMPGLADLHVHATPPEDLFLYPAAGVTTVLLLNAPDDALLWRKQTADGTLLGPTLFTGRYLNGPGTPGEARTLVREAVAQGFDFIKMYNDLTAEQFTAAMEEARRQGIAAVGHAVRAPGLGGLLEGGLAMIVHAEEYLYTIFRRDVTPALIDSAVAITAQAGAYVTPNLSAYEAITRQWGRPAVVDSFLSLLPGAYQHPTLRAEWRLHDYIDRPGSLGDRIAFLRRFTKRLHDGGVPLVLGTDAPGIPGMYAGDAIHEDLRNLTEAGLSPYEALAAGTRNAGAFIQSTVPGSTPFGLVAAGHRADLLLLDADPLSDVRHVRRPAATMVGGRWLPADEADSLRARRAAAYRPLQPTVDRMTKALREDRLPDLITAYQEAGEGAAMLAVFVEDVINTNGYRLLREGRQDEALALFTRNTDLFPEAYNTWDSLAEMYMLRGDRERAIAYYERSLALNPANTNATEMLRRLRAAGLRR